VSARATLTVRRRRVQYPPSHPSAEHEVGQWPLIRGVAAGKRRTVEAVRPRPNSLGRSSAVTDLLSKGLRGVLAKSHCDFRSNLSRALTSGITPAVMSMLTSSDSSPLALCSQRRPCPSSPACVASREECTICRMD